MNGRNEEGMGGEEGKGLERRMEDLDKKLKKYEKRKKEKEKEDKEEEKEREGW